MPAYQYESSATAPSRSGWVRALWLLALSVALWYGARLVGEAYARAKYHWQLSECTNRLHQLAEGFGRYQEDHPEVRITDITSEKLYPAYISDKRLFQCPAVHVSPRQAGTGEIVSTYMWCNRHRDWAYVHGRRGDDIPVLGCSRHARARIGEPIATVVRLQGEIERVRIPYGVDTLEW